MKLRVGHPSRALRLMWPSLVLAQMEDYLIWRKLHLGLTGEKSRRNKSNRSSRLPNCNQTGSRKRSGRMFVKLALSGEMLVAPCILQ